MLSYRDFTPSKHTEELEALDVFFGLSSSWDFYEQKRSLYMNPVLDNIAKKLHGKGIKTVIHTNIPDYSIDNRVFEVINSCFKQGLKIGLGCMGAHGRTGWVLAKLIKIYEQVSGDEAVIRIRKRLCVECVESTRQLEDLKAKKHLKIKEKESKKWESKWIPGNTKLGDSVSPSAPYDAGRFGEVSPAYSTEKRRLLKWDEYMGVFGD